MSDPTIRIETRFQGPPDSGNGGYVAGLLAEHLAVRTTHESVCRGVFSAASVRLRRPPPLERTLVVRPVESGLGLFDADVLIAEARTVELEAAIPEPPSAAEAHAASLHFRGYADHVFPSCFVCGPHRDATDGLCIFPGPVDGRDLVAAPWTPHASLADSDGRVLPEFLWAALDCPGAFAFPQPDGRAVLLGELQVAILGSVATGERCSLIGWQIAHEGRKHLTGTALFGEDNGCRGVALGTWIEVPRE